MRGLVIVAGLAVLAGCGKEICVEPASGGVPTMGDANGDGEVDLADGIFVQRWLFRGGAAPVCAAAVDVVPDGTTDLSDSLLLWSHAFTPNGAFPELAEGACESRSSLSNDLDCGRVKFTLDVPRRADGDFAATVLLHAPDFEVEGWQVAIAAEGCTVESATLSGTEGADTRDGGSRSMGYGRADLADKGVVSAVALSWLDDTALAASGDPYAVLVVHVHGKAPESGCDPCTLRFSDGLVGAGAPVRNMVSHQGRAWLPVTRDTDVKICAE